METIKEVSLQDMQFRGVIHFCNGPFARNGHIWNKKTLLMANDQTQGGRKNRGYIIHKAKKTSFLFKVPLLCLPFSKVVFVPVSVLCKGPNSFLRQYPLELSL